MTKELKPYTCTYWFKSRRIGLTLLAESFERASPRLRAIGMTGVVEGDGKASAFQTGKLQRFTGTYQFDGRTANFVLEAYDVDEASARIRAIGTTAVVDGEQIAEGALFDLAAMPIAKLFGRVK